MHKRFFWDVHRFIVPQIDATTDTTETFSQMKEFSTRIAVWLHKQGVGPREIVAISYNISRTYPLFMKPNCDADAKLFHLTKRFSCICCCIDLRYNK